MSGGIGFLSDGRTASGIGALGVFCNNVCIVQPGAGQTAAGQTRVLFQSADGHICQCAPDGSDVQTLDVRAATFISGDPTSSYWAAFLADGITGVFDGAQHHWPLSGLLGALHEVAFLKTNYQSGGISAWWQGDLLWELPSAQPQILTFPQFSAIDAWRCCWTEGGQLVAYGLPSPAQTEAVFDPAIVEAGGEIWLAYHGGPVVLRKWLDASVGYILAPEGGFYTVARKVDETHIEVAWSRGPGANGDVVTAVVDLTAPMVSLAPTPEPPQPIVVIGRDLFAGWFTGADRSGLPGNSYLQSWQGGDGLVRTNAGTVVAKFISAASDSDLADLNRRCADWDAANPSIPSLGYWTRKAQGLGVCTAKYAGVEAYCHAGEDLAAFEADMRTQMARVPHPWLVAQCYTSNGGNTSDLEALVPVYSRILRDLGDGVLAFSGTDAARGRATGYWDHPEVHDEWTELMAGIPRAPAVAVPPEPPVVIPPEPPIEPPIAPIEPPVEPPIEPPIIVPPEPPIITPIPPTPIPVPPEPEPEEPDMAITVGQRGMFRPYGSKSAWQKGVVVAHQDETLYEGKPIIFGISTNYPSGEGQVCAWLGGGKYEANRSTAGGGERASFDGRNLLIGRPDDFADCFEWVNLA